MSMENIFDSFEALYKVEAGYRLLMINILATRKEQREAQAILLRRAIDAGENKAATIKAIAEYFGEPVFCSELQLRRLWNKLSKEKQL